MIAAQTPFSSDSQWAHGDYEAGDRHVPRQHGRHAAVDCHLSGHNNRIGLGGIF